MKKLFIFLIIIFTFSSCSLTRPFIDSNRDSIYIETYKDTTIYLND